MNQSARTEAMIAHGAATVEMPSRWQGRTGAFMKTLAAAWSGTSVDTTDSNSAPVRSVVWLAMAPVLCAVALLVAQRNPIHWLVVLSSFLASVLAFAGGASLVTWRRAAAKMSAAAEEEGSPLRPEAPSPLPDTEASASMKERGSAIPYVGIILLVLAAICALPILMAGIAALALALALAVVGFALYGVDRVRTRIAPLDEILAPLCLGPGLFCLTILAQGLRMSGRDWLAAAALGAMAFAMIQGRRLCAADVTASADANVVEDTHAQHTLASLFGLRSATFMTGIALLASYTLAIALAVPRGAWPGALLTLTSLPAALLGLSGLASSVYVPARVAAALQLRRAYLWFGLTLALGITLTLGVQYLTAIIVRMIGA